GADLVEFEGTGVSVQIAGAVLQSPEPHLELSRASKMGASEMRVSWSVEGPQKAAPVTPAPTEEDESTGLHARLEQDRARVLALQTLIGFARDRILPRLPPETGIDKMWVTYRRGQEQLHIGPNSLSLKKADELLVSITPQGKTKGTPLALKLAIQPKTAPSSATIELKGGPV